MRYIIAIIASILCCDVISATYYVATTGSNSNSGASGSPWATIAKGVTNLVAGDTLIVSNGVFNEYVTVANSGTLANRITVQAEPIRSVTNLTWNITGSNVTVRGFVTAGTNVPAFGAGFVIGSTAHYSYLYDNWDHDLVYPRVSYGVSQSGLTPNTGPSYWCVSNHLAERNAYVVTSTGGQYGQVRDSHFEGSGNDWMRMKGGNILIAGNSVTALGTIDAAGHPDFWQIIAQGEETCTNILIMHNWFTNSASQICQMESEYPGKTNDIHHIYSIGNVWYRVDAQAGNLGPRDQIWAYNTMYEVAPETGFPLPFNGSTSSGVPDRVRILGNMILNCGGNPSTNSEDAYIDIGLTPTRGWYSYGGSPLPTNVVMAWNYIGGRGPSYTAKSPTGDIFVGNPVINGGNPGLVSESTYDLRPLTNSVLIGAGTNLTAMLTSDARFTWFASVYPGITNDIIGTPRPSSSQWTIGAFEGGTNAPSGGGGGGSSGPLRVTAQSATIGRITGP